MSIESIEASEQDSQPRELIYIVHGATSYRLTSAVRDVTYDGDLYEAAAVSRGELGAPLVGSAGDSECIITLPIDHPLVRRYLQMLVPPLRVAVTVSRLYPDDSIETVWSGDITSMSVDDENTMASFRVASGGAEAVEQLLPTISVSRTCPYILYGAGCNVSRSASVDGLAHSVSTTVIAVNGRDVRVDLQDTDRGDDWAALGELVVTSGTASGERMSIREQNDPNPGISSVAVLSLQLPIPGLKVGDAVTVYAGCDHSIGTCRVKFDNKQSFGGLPAMPVANPFEKER